MKNNQMDSNTKKRRSNLLEYAHDARSRSRSDTSLLLSSPAPTPPPMSDSPSSLECTPSTTPALLPPDHQISSFPSSSTFIAIHHSDNATPSVSSSGASSALASDRLSLPIDPKLTVRKRRSADAAVQGQREVLVPSPEKKLRRVAKSTGSGWDSFSK